MAHRKRETSESRRVGARKKRGQVRGCSAERSWESTEPLGPVPGRAPNGSETSPGWSSFEVLRDPRPGGVEAGEPGLAGRPVCQIHHRGLQEPVQMVGTFSALGGV